MNSYHWIEDPGHAWLVVPIDDVEESGFQPSVFSFAKDGLAFLEEDCDAGGFLDAAGISIEDARLFQTDWVESFDRELPRFPVRELSRR